MSQRRYLLDRSGLGLSGMPRGKRIRVALFATHPIQYHAPWYRQIATQPDIELTVYFGHLLTVLFVMMIIGAFFFFFFTRMRDQDLRFC